MTDHSTVLDLIPLYALDALEAGETVDVEAHLEECDACSEALWVYRAAATSLVGDEPAPEHLWSRIAAAIEDGPATVSHLTAERARRVNPWRSLTLAAAAVALVFGGILVGERLALDDLATGDGVVAAAEAATKEPGALVRDFLVDEVAVARVILTEDGLGYIVPTDALATLDSTRTYQLWVLTPDEIAISAGVLGSDPGPATFTWTDDLAGFALTREVAGGVVSSAGDVVSVITNA